MHGTKAEILADWAARSGFSFTRFDYRGHGQSSGAFLAHTISDWTADARHIIEQVTCGPLILVGSSLGGWIMLNLLNSCRQRIAGLIGIAAAPDFTERLIWQTLNKEQQKQMQQQGHIALPNPYEPGGQLVYPYHLIEDGRANLLLDKPLEFDGPVILHQGMQDEEVPWQTALDIAAVLTSRPGGNLAGQDSRPSLFRAASAGRAGRLSRADQPTGKLARNRLLHNGVRAENRPDDRPSGCDSWAVISSS